MAGDSDNPLSTRIRPAQSGEAAALHAMMVEAAQWIAAQGTPMWDDEDLDPAALVREVAAGQFFLVEADGAVAGAFRFQLEDPRFWPDLPSGDAAFVHRLIVTRPFAGRGLGEVMLAWAVARTRALGRSWLRLDCDADRPKVRALYERFGFRLHSYRQVGSYYVARYEYRVHAETTPV